MKEIKNKPKNILKKFDQKLNLKKDITYTKRLGKIGFSISEEYCEYIKHNKGVLDKPLTQLEEIIAKIDGCLYNKSRLLDVIKELEEYSKHIFEAYERKTQASKDPNVKVKIDLILAKINEVILQMKDVVYEYEDLDQIKALLFNKCLNISSDLGENKHNLCEEFSDLEGAIEQFYDKKRTTLKCVAVGTGAAIALAGIGTGAYAIVDYKADQIMDALVALHGDEESIPGYEYDEYFYENGMPKPGATEQIKERLLSERLKNIINEDLKKSTDKIFIESLKLNYGKSSYNEDSDRGPKRVETDGFSISYKTNIEDDKSFICREDRKEGVMRDEVLNHTEKDEEAKKIRKWLEKLSINDCKNILVNDCEDRMKFESLFKDSILEIENESMQKVIEQLELNNDDGR